MGYREFRFMMKNSSSRNNNNNSNNGGKGSSSSSRRRGEAMDGAVVVTAHIAVDEEALRHDDFQRRLLSQRGLRVRKVNLSRPSRSGMRSLMLDLKGGCVLTWRKGGFKTGVTGKFDLRQLADVVAVSDAALKQPAAATTGGSGTLGGRGSGGRLVDGILLGMGNNGHGNGNGSSSPAAAPLSSAASKSSGGGRFQVRLVSTADSGLLVLEARSAAEQRTLLMAFGG